MSDVYYHYTDKKAAQKIKQSQVIKQSGADGNDAAFGPGTYLTRLNPTVPTKTIAENNYDDGRGFVNDKLNAGKVDSVVAVRIPKDDPKIHKCQAKGRDVHVYEGDLSLADKKHAIGNKSAFDKRKK